MGVIYAEANAVLHGLRMALAHGFSRIEVESDSRTDINSINGVSFDKSYSSLVIAEITNLALPFMLVQAYF